MNARQREILDFVTEDWQTAKEIADHMGWPYRGVSASLAAMARQDVIDIHTTPSDVGNHVFIYRIG